MITMQYYLEINTRDYLVTTMLHHNRMINHCHILIVIWGSGIIAMQRYLGIVMYFHGIITMQRNMTRVKATTDGKGEIFPLH